MEELCHFKLLNNKSNFWHALFNVQKQKKICMLHEYINQHHGILGRKPDPKTLKLKIRSRPKSSLTQIHTFLQDIHIHLLVSLPRRDLRLLFHVYITGLVITAQIIVRAY